MILGPFSRKNELHPSPTQRKTSQNGSERFIRSESSEASDELLKNDHRKIRKISCRKKSSKLKIFRLKNFRKFFEKLKFRYFSKNRKFRKFRNFENLDFFQL